MSGGLTLQQLFDANPDPIAANADAWLAMANTLDDACEDLIRGSRDLPNVWPDGPAAAAAWQRTLDTRNEASNALPRCQTIGRALREFADTVRSLQTMLQSITAEAVKNGYQVDIGAGTVAASQRMYEQASAPHVLAQAASSYMHQLQGLVDRAAEIDAVTTGILKQNLPDTQAGFGSAGSRSLTTADVTAQKDRSPAQVNAWWHGLTAEQQEQVLRDYPELIGWYDGIPAEVRNTANRASIPKLLAALQAEEDALIAPLRGDTPPSGKTVQEVYARLEAINKEQANLDTVTASLGKLGDRGYLLGVDPRGDGRAIVSVGNPDTADNVLTYVSGTFSNIPSMDEEVQRAATIADQAKKSDPDYTTASIMWLGADAPSNFVAAGDEKYAVQGAPVLQDFQSGLRATHEGGPSHNTVMGHSYGSTVVGYAARDSLATDEIIFIGSPGVGVDRATDLHFDGGAANVHTSTASNDPIRVTEAGKDGDDIYKYGQNPDTPKFGGSRFSSADGNWFTAHTAYMDKGNPSLDHIADIVIGAGTRQ